MTDLLKEQGMKTKRKKIVRCIRVAKKCKHVAFQSFGNVKYTALGVLRIPCGDLSFELLMLKLFL